MHRVRRRHTAIAAVATLLLSAAACTSILGIDDLHQRPGPDAGSVTIAPSTMDFGGVNCGAGALAKTVTLTNTTPGSVTWSAALANATDTQFAIAPTSGTIPPGSQTSITVTPKAIPLDAGTPVFTDQLIVTTSALDASQNIALKETAQGAIVIVSPDTIAFERVLLGSSGADASVTVTNRGDDTASITLDAAGFVFSPASIDLPPDASIVVSVSFRPIALGPASASVSFAPGASCAPAQSVKLGGEGVGVASKICAGYGQTCVTFGGGKVACWGRNDLGQVGNGTRGGAVPVPTQLPAIDDAVDIACGWVHTCVARKSGKVTCWGNNAYGAIGNGAALDAGPPPPVPSPVDVVGISTAVAVGAGHHASYALLKSGALMAWGDNARGSLGDGRAEPGSSVPVPVLDPSGRAALTNVTGVSSWGDNGMALLADGTALCWGPASNCATATGGGPLFLPKPVLSMPDAGPLPSLVGVSSGTTSSCAVQDGGRIFCWGMDDVGQVGDGIDLDAGPGPGITSPVAIGDSTSIVSIGFNHVCALIGNPAIPYCWGDNSVGELGSGTFVASSAGGASGNPVPAGVVKSVSVAAGAFYSCIVSSTGAVLCWGDNSAGQLGLGYIADAGDDAPASAFGIPTPQTALGFDLR